MEILIAFPTIVLFYVITLLSLQITTPEEQLSPQQVCPHKRIHGSNFISFLVAVTFAETQGPDNKKCADLFPFYKPGCKFYGNGQHGEGLGACVKDDTSPCPQEETQGIKNEHPLNMLRG